MQGTVTWFNIPKGYGEIIADNGSLYFFTYRELVQKNTFKSIDAETRVQFLPTDENRFGLPLAAEITVQKRITVTKEKERRRNNEITNP